MKPKDALSILGFGFEENSFNNFISTSACGETFGLKYNTVDNQKKLTELREKINSLYKKGDQACFFNKPYSGVSFSITEALKALNGTSENYYRTYLIHVTDNDYNGLKNENARGELNKLRNKIGNKKFREKINLDYNNILMKYNFREIREEKLCDFFNKDKKEYSELKYTLYEVLPNIEGHLNLASILDLKEEYSIYPIKGRDIEVVFNLTDRKVDDEYLPLESKISIINADSTTIGSPIRIKVDEAINLRIPEGVITNNLMLKIETTIEYREKLYGAHLITAFGADIQGAKELVRYIPIKFGDGGKILGFIPLSNIFYSISKPFVGLDFQSNIQFWNYLVIAAILLLMIFSVYKYIKNNKTITEIGNVVIKRNLNPDA